MLSHSILTTLSVEDKTGTTSLFLELLFNENFEAKDEEDCLRSYSSFYYPRLPSRKLFYRCSLKEMLNVYTNSYTGCQLTQMMTPLAHNIGLSAFQ